MPDKKELIDKMRDIIANQLSTRTLRVMPESFQEGKRTVRAIAVTENPVQVMDWDRWDIVDEVILTDGIELPPTGQVPLLDTHDRSSVTKILGSCRDFAPNGPQEECNIEFSSVPEGESAMTKCKEGHLTDLSIGYRSLEKIWIPENTTQTITTKGGAQRSFTGPVQVSVRTLVKELSACPIGADVMAKVREEFRALPDLKLLMDAILANPNPAGDAAAGQSTKERTTEGVITMADPVKDPPAATKTQEEIRKEELERMDSIDKWGSRFVGRVEKIQDIIADAKRTGASVAEFKGLIADKLSEKGEPFTNDHKLDLTNQQKREYSLARLIHASASGKPEDAPFEMECSRAVEKKFEDMGETMPSVRQGAKTRSLWIPHDIMHRSIGVTPEMRAMAERFGLLNKRDMSVGTTTAGGHLVGTNLLAGEFIEMPMNLLLFKSLGARVLEGLVGNIDLPKKTGRSTFYWVETEGNAPTESDPTVNKVSLSPKVGGTFVDYTFKLLLQSTPGVDSLLQADLLEAADIGIDLACFHGTGATGQPKGMDHQTGIGTVDGAGLGWEALIEFITDLGGSNTLAGKLAFATNWTNWGLMKTREKWTNSGQPLIDDNNRAAGFPVGVSNQITGLFFADWSQKVLGMWGGYNLLIDPYTSSSTGTTRVRILAAVDVASRIATALSYAATVS